MRIQVQSNAISSHDNNSTQGIQYLKPKEKKQKVQKQSISVESKKKKR